MEAAVETALDRAGRPQVVEGASEESWKTSVRKSAVERSLEEMLFEVVSSHLVLFFFWSGGIRQGYGVQRLTEWRNSRNRLCYQMTTANLTCQDMVYCRI